MRLWVDDERPAPDDSWRVCKTSKEAADFLLDHVIRRGQWLEEVSLDHDLGGDDTGMKVLNWMINEDVWPETLTIHTSNPPARKQMLAAANAEAPMWVGIYVIYDHLDKDSRG